MESKEFWERADNDFRKGVEHSINVRRYYEHAKEKIKNGSV